MTEQEPHLENHEEDINTSYEEAMQARLDRLAKKAKSVRRRKMLSAIGAFFVLVLVTVAALLLMRQCTGGTGFEDSFGWREPRR